jgi:multidrug efflux system outer membrane protein
MKERMHRSLIALGASLLLAACATPPPPPDRATPVLPTQWQAAAADCAAACTGWQAFGSAELDALSTQALARNLDLAAAAARVAQADAAVRIAGAALQPQLTAQLDASRQDRLGGEAVVAGRSLGASLGAQYEIDFWGRHRAARDSVWRGLQASVFDRDTVRLALLAGVATNWLQAVSAAERSEIAALNHARATRVLALVEARARAGAATPLELAQQRGLVATQARSLAALRQQAVDARTALALLLGETGARALRTTSLEGLAPPALGAGLPSELLARRPDVAAAEARLAAAEADVAAARAAMLPRVTLGGSLGYAGDRMRTLFDNPLYSLAAGLAAPVFDAGRLAAEAGQATARRTELLANYHQAIVAAFGDVEVALNAVDGSRAQAEAQAEELLQAGRAATLAESRYRAGAETLLTLLDAQRTLYAAQDEAVQARLARLQAGVALHRALGGGWQVAEVSR